jgi:hypothetical protein
MLYYWAKPLERSFKMKVIKSKKEIQDAIKAAVDSVGLEGLIVSEKFHESANKVITGESDIEQLIAELDSHHNDQ